MLDTETKRRIDTARDILVGKVPDPKSQVEQITIALIYKFMDDMDAEAEELGGQRKFFTGEFVRYGWAKLMSPSIGGHELINLYGEGIAKMPENPGIPPLFRDIFKNAYLPYRDPETLKSFLKIINEFSYDHSERLGDAFEYLLSVLGSQGDAGQFRTPRHIIDFIVDIIAPKKGEVILDPACGTGGFLISSYKYVRRNNLDEKNIDTLTPDEKRRLAQNFKGYDISPDMVRLSLVNMYLHGFTDPHVFEYDTLTSEERWNEFADVILANPPFMSPKGGIKPHKRFTIQAKRSEVLFVDYIAEHLTPNGRAGIIVPEGIIFQSQTAYKNLRKMLVENSLIAVISLPSGVFNPYSSVKTSILILDKSLAKQSNSIAFFKIENDGFNLGAQRRPATGEQLSQVKIEFTAYLQKLRSQHLVDNVHSMMNQIISKEKIREDGKYNLSVERYSDKLQLIHPNWPTVLLGEISTFMTGGTPTSTIAEYYENGTIPWLVSGDIHKFEIWDCEKRITQKAIKNSNARILPRNSVLIALNGQGKTRGTVALLRMEGATCNQSLVAITPSPLKATCEFIFWILRSMYTDLRALTGNNERSGLNIPILKSIQIPIPPLEVQKEIVAEIECYQKIINSARAVLANYYPHIPIHPDWPLVKLGEICSYSGGTQPPKETFVSDPKEGYIRLLQIRDYKSDANAVYIPKSEKHKTCDPDDIMIGRYGPPVFQILKGKRGAYNVALIKCIPNLMRLDRMWLYYFLKSPKIQNTIIALSGRVRQAGVRPDDLNELEIPLPPLSIQQAIIAKIDAEQKLINSNHELVTIFEKKIQIALDRIWGKDDKSAVKLKEVISAG